MKQILYILLFLPALIFAQSGNIREVAPADLMTASYYLNETIKVKGGGYYNVTAVPNSKWNGNNPDSIFCIKVPDANPQGRNSFKASEDLSNQAYWIRAGTPDGFTVIENTDIAPDGSGSADRFVYVNGSPLRAYTNLPIIQGATYTVSLNIKVPPAHGNNDMRVRVELNDYSAGRVTIQPDTISKSWGRYTAYFIANATNQNPFVDIDFAAAGVDIGDTLALWGLQFEEVTTTDYKRTEITPTTPGYLYLNYIAHRGTVVVDELNNTGLEDYQLIQKALDYCGTVTNTGMVLIESNRTLTDGITIPRNVTLQGLHTGSASSGTYASAKTTVYLDLRNCLKTAITFQGNQYQLTGNGLKNILFIPVSAGYALLNTGNVIMSDVENIEVASWSTAGTRWLDYGIIIGAGSLANVFRDIKLLHLNKAGFWSVSSSIVKLDNIWVNEAPQGVVVTAAALYIDGGWFENLDSSALVFSGNLCHLNRVYTEDVPKSIGVASRTFNITKCSVFSVMNSDLQGGQLVADSLQVYIYLDSVRTATIMNNQVQASRINLVTTANTGYVTWINNVESNNSDVKVIDKLYQHVFNRDRIIIIGSTGQNSFIPSDNWMPHLKTNRLNFQPYTASEANALAPVKGMLIYVDDVIAMGPFIENGWYGYNGLAWQKLNN